MPDQQHTQNNKPHATINKPINHQVLYVSDISMFMEENTVSLMLTTYNRLDLTKRMLSSLFETTTSPFRLIIVDNGSIDGTVDWLKAMPQDHINCRSYDFHFNKNNLGIASGRNLGLQIAGKYGDRFLGCLDNDVEMPVGWLEKCINIIKAIPRMSIGVNMEDARYPLITQNGQKFQLKGQGNLGSACMIFGKELHEKIGYFYGYENFYGEEDADWGFRARQVGWRLGYLEENGKHFGVAELDSGEYREFKDECRKKNLERFRQNCVDYSSGKKSVYVPFSIKSDQ